MSQLPFAQVQESRATSVNFIVLLSKKLVSTHFRVIFFANSEVRNLFRFHSHHDAIIKQASWPIS